MEESVQKFEESQPLLNKQDFLEFIRGKRKVETEMETSVINYNPNRNLSKVMSKSQLKKPLIEDPLAQQHFVSYFGTLCEGSEKQRQMREMLSGMDVTPQKLQKLIG